MSERRDINVYLTDILQAINKIEQYTNNMSLDDFRHDIKTQDAVVRNLEIIGEAVKHIPDDVCKKYPDISWRPAAAMRDFLIHNYPAVDADAVWETISNDLPLFKKGISKVQQASKKGQK